MLISSINPAIATKLLIACISGGYHDAARLKAIKNYLSNQSNTIFALAPHAPELSFYEGIKEIIYMLPKRKEDQVELIHSIRKITDFAKQASEALLVDLLPLFYNKFYRQLLAHALDAYWHTQDDLFHGNPRTSFDGYIETKEYLNTLRDRLSSELNVQLNAQIQYLNLLCRFEKDLHDAAEGEKTASGYREMAFHALDWMPVFIERSNKSLWVNLFLQIGILFQHASHLENMPSKQMADEQLAFKFYLTAFSISQHTTPDIEIYITTHITKYLSVFQFATSKHDEHSAALKKCLLMKLDMYPFFEAPLSNIALFKQDDRSLRLMRQLLNVMIHAYEHNKTHTDTIPIDHSVSNILYQAYEACLKNWYQEQFDPETEKKFRLDLMEELLLDNCWDSFDVETLIDSPWIMVDRDEQGWLKPTRALPFDENAGLVQYRSINGVEINHETGNIEFFMTPWTRDRSVNEKTFTLFDLEDMLERSLGNSFFSLDPVDPDKPYHPFNLMRFAPAQLFESELLNSMLLTDYILKFLTTNQEVKGRYPFDQRPVEEMISHLPQYLREIIETFQQAPHSGALHRFWIEAEEIDVALTEPTEVSKYTRIGLGEMKMIVKKHRMERDIHGELKDVSNDNEGWPVYVLNSKDKDAIHRGERKISDRAMIFIYATEEVYFYEHNECIKAHQIQDYRETLIRLFKQPKTSEGLVEVTTKNMPLIYRLTNEVTSQANQPHNYSAEFIFAYEFTRHYDEFAQYLPEFGRLKELSKISVLVRFLSGMHQNNHESLEALDYLLATTKPSVMPKTSTFEGWAKIDLALRQNISDIFNNCNREFSVNKVRKEYQEHWNRVKQSIGTLDFSPYSSEVEQIFDDLVNQNVRANNYRFSSYEIRDKLSNQRAEIAKMISSQKKESVRKQLREVFSSDRIVDAFISGNITPAVETQVKEVLQKQFPDNPSSDIASAIEQNAMAISRIATRESHKNLNKQREPFKILERGFDQINLGKNKEPIDQEDVCLWVPASVRHEVKKNDTTGLTRYSFFVYGGVNLQARTNIISGKGALVGNAIGGRSFNRNNTTKGFQDHHIASNKNKFTKDHELWKLSGLNVNSRINKVYLPKTAEQHPTRSIHSGRHTNAYSENMAEQMKQVVRKGKDAGWTPSQYRDATRRLLSNMKQELRAGNIALNKNHRPWAK